MNGPTPAATTRKLPSAPSPTTSRTAAGTGVPVASERDRHGGGDHHRRPPTSSVTKARTRARRERDERDERGRRRPPARRRAGGGLGLDLPGRGALRLGVRRRTEVGERRPTRGRGGVGDRRRIAVVDRGDHVRTRPQSLLERPAGTPGLGVGVGGGRAGADDHPPLGVVAVVVDDELAGSQRRRPVHRLVAVALAPRPHAVDLAGDRTRRAGQLAAEVGRRPLRLDPPRDRARRDDQFVHRDVESRGATTPRPSRRPIAPAP